MVLKTREKMLLGAALLVGAFMGFDTFMTRPKDKEAAALRTQVQEASEKLITTTNSLTGLRAIKRRVEEKRKEKEINAGRIADARQLSLFLDQLGKESQRKQIEIIQLTINYDSGIPAEEKKGKSFKKVVLDVGLLAGYGAIGPYLEGIQALPIFLEVERVDITRKEASFAKLQVNIQQSLYMSRTKVESVKANVKEMPPAS